MHFASRYLSSVLKLTICFTAFGNVKRIKTRYKVWNYTVVDPLYLHSRTSEFFEEWRRRESSTEQNCKSPWQRTAKSTVHNTTLY